MLLGARGGEGTGDGDEDDLLLLELCESRLVSLGLKKVQQVKVKLESTFAGLVLDGQAAAVEAGLVGRVGDVEEANVLGEGLAGERCHFD